MWILISWLHQKPADLDLHSFQKTVNDFESYAHSALIMLICMYSIYFLSKDIGQHMTLVLTTHIESEYGVPTLDIWNLNMMSYLALKYPAFLSHFFCTSHKLRICFLFSRTNPHFQGQLCKIPGQQSNFQICKISRAKIKFKDFSRSL